MNFRVNGWFNKPMGFLPAYYDTSGLLSAPPYTNGHKVSTVSPSVTFRSCPELSPKVLYLQFVSFACSYCFVPHHAVSARNSNGSDSTQMVLGFNVNIYTYANERKRFRNRGKRGLKETLKFQRSTLAFLGFLNRWHKCRH